MDSTINTDHHILLSTALQAGKMGAWRYEVEEGVFYFTEDFYRVFKTTAEAEGGNRMSPETYAERFIPKEYRGIVAEELEQALATTDPDFSRQLRHPVRFRDGTRGHIQVSYGVEFDSSGKVVRTVGVNQDLTEHYNHLDLLEKQKAELLRLNEALEIKSREATEAKHAQSLFLASMSHEIRTPMSGIIGITRLLMDENMTGEQHEMLQVLYSSSEAMLLILNNILDFTKIEADRLEVESVAFDIQRLINSVGQLFETSIRSKEIHFSIHTCREFNPRRRGDSAKLRQILNNLLSNAMKFTETGEISISLSGSVEQVVIEVADTGIGMSEEEQAYIFDPFKQARRGTYREYGGTGLGLAICKRLAEAMHGKLELRSTPGRGSVFTLTLPFPETESADH